MNTKWLEWASKLQSIAQAGLSFSTDRYDLERYRQIRNLSIEIMNEYTDISPEKIRDLFAGETGYQTPKIDIRAAVIRDDEILLVREKIDNAWALPGGWADVNSSVRESVVRECTEEAGAEVEPLRIIAVQLANKHNNPFMPYTIYKIFVDCEFVKMDFRENTETMEAGFFRMDSLPDLSVSRTTKEQVAMCFEAKKHKIHETLFD